MLNILSSVRRSLRFLVIFAAALSVSAGAQNAPSQPTEAPKKPCPVSEPIVDNLYHPGDVWLYRAGPDDEGSTLTILKVETLPEIGTIVHIRVDGLHMRNGAGEIVPSVEHMPFARWALAKSTLRKLRADTVPDFAEGYGLWKKGCGGVYTISVADAIAVDRKTLLQGSTPAAVPKP